MVKKDVTRTASSNYQRLVSSDMNTDMTLMTRNAQALRDIDQEGITPQQDEVQVRRKARRNVEAFQQAHEKAPGRVLGNPQDSRQLGHIQVKSSKQRHLQVS